MVYFELDFIRCASQSQRKRVAGGDNATTFGRGIGRASLCHTLMSGVGLRDLITRKVAPELDSFGNAKHFLLTHLLDAGPDSHKLAQVLRECDYPQNILLKCAKDFDTFVARIKTLTDSLSEFKMETFPRPLMKHIQTLILSYQDFLSYFGLLESILPPLFLLHHNLIMC